MASLSKICEFCLETVLLTKTSWGYHQPSRWSLANSARHGCTFCKVIYEDVQSRLEIMKSYECDSDFLRHWLLDEVVDTDQSLYRWSLRSLGRAREDKKTMAITFRPIPVRVQSLDPTQAPATLGLPERVFYCFPEAELGKLLNTSELGKTTDPFVTGGQQIMNWMEECSTKHSNCPKLAGSAIIFVPTRLLHIGGRRPGDAIKVVDTKSGNVRSAYVTLSHCWGQLPLITLQSSTVKEFTTVGVPWHQLSSNFQQAIEVAWFLKIDYIWIDSLCIKQGDSEDWKREGSRMEKVYRHSYCNIAAADARDGDGGLFRVRNPQDIIAPCFQLSKESAIFGNQKWCVFRGDLWEHELLKKPLYTRGWVYQERMLAPRIVHFSKNQIFWDCIRLSACEMLPSGLPLPLDQQSAMDRNWRERLQGSTRGTKLLFGTSGDSLEDLWLSSVNVYTGLKLSNQSDKRMAIWGIAKRIRDMLNERYVVGMWEWNLEEQLGWKVADCTVAKRLQDLPNVPTWSWTSMNGEITVPDRSQTRQRSWIVSNHTGKRISYDIGTYNYQSGMSGNLSDTLAGMTEQLNLVDERREKIASLRERSICVEDNHVDEITSRPVTSLESCSVTSDQEVEPELRSIRLAIQGSVHRGYLGRHSLSGNRSFMISSTDEEGTNIIPFPDINLGAGEVLFVILALTLLPYTESEETSDGSTWYEGHGLLLEKAEDIDCFRRIGALEIRHLSCQLWQKLRTTSESWEDMTTSGHNSAYIDFFLV